MKIERFLICKNPLVKEGATYILCTRPPALFDENFNFIFGESDEGLKKRAQEWYKAVKFQKDDNL